MALIYQYAIALKDELASRYGAEVKETDNCAGQFFTLSVSLSEEIKTFIREFLDERRCEPIFWDDNSFSVRDLFNKKHNM